MTGINMYGMGINPYADSYSTSAQNEYRNNQLAAAYEKSSIILPDNPVIL